MKNIRSIVMISLFAVLIFAFSALCLFAPKSEYSDSERRYLADMPEISAQSISSGAFMTDFEQYAQDNFPLRDIFRSIKAHFVTKVLGKSDNNGVFEADGHLSKIDADVDINMLNIASDKFAQIVDTYAKDKNAKLYFSIVPDKNMFIAQKNGYPSVDYEQFIEQMRLRTEFLNYIDITHLLDADDYYYTDTHWRQECITDVAEFVAQSMGTELDGEYRENILDHSFYGVYAGQSALNPKGDTIKYLTNDAIDNAKVTYYGDGRARVGKVYDMDKARGKDPYEMFLGGSEPVVVMENPDAHTKKELIIFRDSFGSSLAPLLLDGYSKVTVLDIRYMSSSFIGNFADFEDSDVLFLYSTAILNSSTALR